MMKKYLWQMVTVVLLVGLIFTSVSWANAKKSADAAQTALELAFDSAFTSGYFSLLNIEKIMDDAVKQGNYSITQPGINLAFYAHSLRGAINQAQFGEHLANQKTDFFFAAIGNPASQFIGLLLSIDAELTRSGGQLSSQSRQVLSQIRDNISQLKVKWGESKEPSISREGLSEDEIYVDETEANQIAEQIKAANSLLEQLLALLS